MGEITLQAIVDEKRHFEFELPDDFPLGPIEVVIRPKAQTDYESPPNPAREAARAKLLAAGFLVTSIRAPEGTVPLTPEEIMRIGKLPEGARPSHELIDEDRGEY